MGINSVTSLSDLSWLFHPKGASEVLDAKSILRAWSISQYTCIDAHVHARVCVCARAHTHTSECTYVGWRGGTDYRASQCPHDYLSLYQCGRG